MTHAPHTHAPLTRRSLIAAGGIGLSVGLLARPGWAADAALARRKVVVLICRGGMDGLSVTPPVGDANYAALRREIAIAPVGAPGGALAYDTTFGLHPKLGAIARLAAQGQARIVPSVAMPTRVRSHFEAQDMLESGSLTVYGETSGWLNRALTVMGPQSKLQAISVGGQAPLILRGKEVAASWSPGRGLESGARLPGLLADLYANDPLLGPALAKGLETESMVDAAMQEAAVAMSMSDTPAMPDPMSMTMATGAPVPARVQANNAEGARKIGSTLAGLMTQPGGPSIAAVSLDGFDTHQNQGGADGALANRLVYLDAVVDGLARGLGPAWNDTVVIVATEFGRTARVNGTRGTDHGTASTAILLGGGLKKGGIIGDWPGLTQTALYENRDLAPTLDMRSLMKGVLAEQYGMDRRALDTVVFPDSGNAAPLTGLIA